MSGVTAEEEETALAPNQDVVERGRTDASPLHSSLKYIVKYKWLFALGGLAVVTTCVAVSSIALLIVRGEQGKCPNPEGAIIPNPCDDDWIWYRRRCYYFSKNISEWMKSQDFCASKNATLAIIDSRHELDFILRFKGSPDHWIGLRRESDGSPWVWTNGSTFNDTFPIFGVSDCVLVNSGRISSASCYSDKRWICNKPDAHSKSSHF